MAVDYGERRIGVAVSDPTRTIASPAGFIVRRAGKRPPIAEIMRRAEAHGVSGFVLGLPLDGEGEDTARSLEVRRIGDELLKRTGLPVVLVDERFSTAAALRAIREMGGSTRGRKGDVDALAATILLQQHLDAVRRRAQAGHATDASALHIDAAGPIAPPPALPAPRLTAGLDADGDIGDGSDGAANDGDGIEESRSAPEEEPLRALEADEETE